MAISKHTTSRISSKADPAVQAAVLVRRASDAAYATAVAKLITAPATTTGGVLEQFKILRERIDGLANGDQMSPASEAELDTLCEGIQRALERLTSS